MKTDCPHCDHSLKVKEEWLGRKVINGDLSDLRHLEDGKKIIVGLTAKGKAIKNFNGFVQDV